MQTDEPAVEFHTNPRGQKMLVLDNDIIVSYYYDTDGCPCVQIDTSPDTDSWESLRVFMNDAEAVRWK